MQNVSKINKFDLGWLVVSFGMAIGAGIVLVPVSIGVVGFVVFAISILIAYPGIYLFQKLYICTLFASDKPKIYKDVVGELLGKNWSIFLGILYFLMMLIWTVIYAEVVAKSLAAYLYLFNITNNPHLEQNILYSAILMVVLIFAGMKSQRILIRVSTIFVVVLIVAIIVVSLSLILLWTTVNIMTLPNNSYELVTKTIIMLPFSLTSILFIQSLSPMVLGYRLRYPNFDNSLVLKKCLRTMKLAFVLLVIFIGFYVLSFSFVIPKQFALEASAKNQSAFLLLEQHGMSNIVLYVCGIVISICAILTSFLSILAGMAESLKGVLRMSLNQPRITEKISPKVIDIIVILIIFFLTWLSIVFDAPVYTLVPLSGPIFGILGCLAPAYMVFKVPALKIYRTKSIYFVIFVGIILVISPLLTSAFS
ncbi:amino acid permease [Allofrancisella inopinata]|uniref:Serine permease n=1 Tax=Allofrancisella inopinata TaxID=1085647 RepID=A0AAE7CRB9_9GAMM|nr:serine permease [Allofrancisella inopinata]QIV95478.1 serine permease [Allofrancisella inopinata]TDT72613.1 amino acid permease [Allofrancisella inopinata]